MVKRKNQTESANIKQAQRVGLFGASGCGKTTKARRLTAGLNRIIYFDPLAELTNSAGVKAFYDIEKLKKALEDKEDIEKDYHFKGTVFVSENEMKSKRKKVEISFGKYEEAIAITIQDIEKILQERLM